ncbi:MAG: LacI family DNA-binding transcriptional regulator [Nocardioides sp.]
MAKVTLQSIADRVGVSRMTVSNAFSRPDQLSAELREKILAAAAELGYAGPNPAARALARGRAGSVGMLMNGTLSDAFEDPMSAAFLAAVTDEIAARGLALTLLTPATDDTFVATRDVAMDGALLHVCGDPQMDDIAWLERRSLPVVNIDRHPRSDTPTVNVDDRGGARLAAQHLVDLGHRRIGIINLQEKPYAGRPVTDLSTMSTDFPTTQRMLGWRDVLEPAGIEAPTAVSPHSAIETVREATRVLLDRPDRPTALLCYSDAFAVGVLQAAESLGLRVPHDLSVVGFDDGPLAENARPPLTTVHQDFAAKGRTAVGILVDVLADNPPTDLHVTLPTSLVVRESTAPPMG